MYTPSNHFPRQFRPMLAVQGAKPKDDPDWIVEPKLDGYRLLVFSDGRRVTFASRNGYGLDRLTRPLIPAIQDLHATYPSVSSATYSSGQTIAG